MALSWKIYKRLPDALRSSIEYFYQRDKHGGEEYELPARYRNEIEQSDEFQNAVNVYFDLYDIDYKSSNTDGLSMESTYNLYSIIRDIKPSVVVETGVANGVSSLSVLIALQKNQEGKLISIDHPVHLDYTADELSDTEERFIGWRIPKDKQPGWIIPEEYRERWEFVQGKSVDELPKVVNENDIDVFIHDSLHTTTNMIFEFFITYHSMEDDGVILSDDTSKSEAFEIFCTEIDVSDCRKFQNDLGYIKK